MSNELYVNDGTKIKKANGEDPERIAFQTQKLHLFYYMLLKYRNLLGSAKMADFKFAMKMTCYMCKFGLVAITRFVRVF